MNAVEYGNGFSCLLWYGSVSRVKNVQINAVYPGLGENQVHDEALFSG